MGFVYDKDSKGVVITITMIKNMVHLLEDIREILDDMLFYGLAKRSLDLRDSLGEGENGFSFLRHKDNNCSDREKD